MPAYVVAHLARDRGTTPGRRTPLKPRIAKRVLSKHGGVLLEPSSQADDQSADVITIRVADMTRADQLAAELRNMKGIEAAYAKPGEELP